MRTRPRAASAAPVLSFLLTLAADAAAKPGDPADRGLDLFVHAPKNVRAGDNAVLDLLAYGFVTVTDPKPLDKATIIATWDPESLGDGVATAPGDITTTTDARGHATLSVPMPDGDARQLTLLVSLRHGEHVRTRKITMKRTAKHRLSLRLADANVVPGSQVPAWVTVTDRRTGDPVKGASVEVAIREGDLARQIEHVVTDGSGLARTALWIPAKATGTPALTLRARLPTANKGFVDETVGISLREELPATPKLFVRWKEPQLKPGEVGHASIEIVDAAGEPIANHAVRYWTGPKGTSAPTDEKEWVAQSKAATTDGLGRIEVTAQAPQVVTSTGSSVTIVVKTELESQTIEKKEAVIVGLPVAEASIELESGEVVPGAKQRAYLHVSFDDKGVAGAFSVEADGLKANVTTDRHGDAELTWNVPEDIGATRGSGPCAGGVAAAVTVRQVTPIPALSRHPEPFELCVRVLRERAALLRPSVYVARIGDKVGVKVEGGKRAFRGAGSVAFTASDGTGTAQWSDRDEATIDLTNATPGVHDVSFAAARLTDVAETSQTQILVVPKVLPKLSAKLAGGKLTPGSDVDVDVALDDGHGHPLVGNVSAVIIDKEGGGSIEGLKRLDTRLSLCYEGHAGEERCDAFLEGDPSTEVLRRSSLSTNSPHPLLPELDPAADAKKNLKETFSDVLHSLEGAVFQSQTPESLRDVRRKENGRWVFNPELMTLVTAAMSEQPTTPGGDPFRLNDLIAVDPQVTFDNVARRVTRLKLFNVLSTIRNFAFEEKLGANEPALRDPNALLRRLVRAGKIDQSGLLDPWGGTFKFVRGGSGLPFLTVSPGWELHAPGPDGRVGTGDDVRDPFERVVRSGSPYAEAMGEDEIVDSRLDMRVGDATVSKWQEMFDRLTGQALGGVGEGGGGQGFGMGHGRLGGAHKTKSPSIRMGYSIATNTTTWTDPVRTDDRGKARIRVHLGDYETTWQIALLARSDAGQSALASVEAPAYLPVSAHLDLGRKLTLGDAIAGRIIVRNRTAQPKSVALDVGAEGGLALAAGQPKTLTVEVPPNAVRAVYAKYNAAAEGTGRATVVLRGAGIEGDRTSMEIGIQPPGEPLVITNSIEVAKSGRLRVPVPPGWALRDRPRLVIESGLEGALLDALASFEPEPSSSPDALADAIEVAARIEKIGEARNDKALVTRSRRAAELARTYLASHEHETPRGRTSFAHAILYPPPDEKTRASYKALHTGDNGCPKKGESDSLPIHLLLETEPPPSADGPAACFTTLTAGLTSKAPLDLARATLALADRPHRTALADNQARDLAKATFADGGHEPVFDGTRAEKAIVLAALSRTASVWSKDETMGRKLGQTILTLRDARGGYGSAEATRDVVRAFAALEAQSPAAAARVTVIENGTSKPVDVAPRGKAIVELAANTTTADVAVSGGPVAVRLERPVLRRFLSAPETTVTPVQVAIDWPPDAKANATGVVHVSYTTTSGHDVKVHTQVPLPPGVELAGPVKDGVLRQGVVHLFMTLSGSDTVSIPVRFSLAGTMLVPEAETRTTSEEQPRTLSPARWLTVH